MKVLKSLSYIGLVTLSLGLIACSSKDEQAQLTQTDTAQQENVEKISIGFQKSSLNLLVARDQKLLEQQFPGAKLEWREFPAGPQMLEALAVGAVDFGSVGNTPPIFAQAANKELTYVGYEVYPSDSQALVIHPDSNIQSIADLKGKKIAVQKGSSAHELLAKILQKAGLSWQDIEPIWLPPADARAAFDKKSIDAWSIWDPFLSAAELSSNAKVLVKNADFAPTYSFYIGSPQFIQKYPNATAKFNESLNQADQWILNHQAEALDIFQKNTGLAPEVAKQAFDRRLKPSPILELNATVIEAQQNIANLFEQEKLIPKHIDVQRVIWTNPSKH